MKSKKWKESWSLFPTDEKFTEHRRIEWSKHFGSISRTIERVRRTKHKDWKKTTFDKTNAESLLNAMNSLGNINNTSGKLQFLSANFSSLRI